MPENKPNPNPNSNPKHNPNPLSSFDPPYTVHEMTDQNFQPDYLTNNSIYKTKQEAEEDNVRNILRKEGQYKLIELR